MKPVISVIGAGLMGTALVRTFLKAGYETHVWNRTSSRATALIADGAKVAETIANAAKAADLIVLNVSNYAVCSQLLQDEHVRQSLRGKMLVQLTTGTPRHSREFAGWAEKNQIPYLDGAILVTPDLVGGQECAVLYSGPEALFTKHKTVFESLGGKAIYLGPDYGYASTLDSAILAFFWAYNLGVHQSIALCQAEGFPVDLLVQSVADMTPFLQRFTSDAARRIANQEFHADLATLDICHQSVRLLIEQSTESGVNADILKAFDSIFQKAIEAGHNQSDLAVINKFMRAPAAEAASRA